MLGVYVDRARLFAKEAHTIDDRGGLERLPEKEILVEYDGRGLEGIDDPALKFATNRFAPQEPKSGPVGLALYP